MEVHFFALYGGDFFVLSMNFQHRFGTSPDKEIVMTDNDIFAFIFLYFMFKMD